MYARCKAFTMIELLVVVGIIVVLLAIVLPTLGTGREQARRGICLSNLRQCGLCFREYANISNDACTIGFTSGSFKQLDYSLNTYQWVTGSHPTGTIMIGLMYDAGMMPKGEVWYCPDTFTDRGTVSSSCYNDRPFNPWPPGAGGNTYSTRSGYGCRPILNNIAGGYWPTTSIAYPTTYRKLMTLQSKAILADYTGYAGDVENCHESGVNVLYGDGSAHWLPLAVFNANYSHVTSALTSANNNYILTDNETSGVWADYDTQH
jgi:prepilin-type N-terminal cleavage/methylation domain-containing protein/prepilin-type processing-associated H-X9-DG protein